MARGAPKNLQKLWYLPKRITK